MSSSRDETLKALKRAVVPALRDRGFRGSLPHLRRARGDVVDLFSVQFSKWGDGFIVELGSGRPEDLRDPQDNVLPVERAKSYNAPKRARLSAGPSRTRDRWFRFRSMFGLVRRSPDRLAADVFELLPIADRWWAGSEDEDHIVPDRR